MIRRAGAAILALAMAACSSAPVATAPPAPPPLPPVHAPEVQASALPIPPSGDHDQCGAAALQSLVGRPRGEIPVPVNPARQRVACTTCPVTQDYDPTRLNFFFDADSGMIRQVRCG